MMVGLRRTVASQISSDPETENLPARSWFRDAGNSRTLSFGSRARSRAMAAGRAAIHSLTTARTGDTHTHDRRAEPNAGNTVRHGRLGLGPARHWCRCKPDSSYWHFPPTKPGPEFRRARQAPPPPKLPS